MKKGILVVGIVCLMLVLFISGCTEEKDSGTGGGTTGNLVCGGVMKKNKGKRFSGLCAE